MLWIILGFAIIFAGIWGYWFWQELPDTLSLVGFGFILVAILMCSPLFKKGTNTA